MFYGHKRGKYFSKYPKTQETCWKSTRNRPKIGCANRHSKSADRHSKGADWHLTRIRPIYSILCFRALFRSVMTPFFTKKIDCAIKFTKNFMNCQTRAFKHALSICFPKKNQSPASLFSKRRRQENWSNQDFSKSGIHVLN